MQKSKETTIIGIISIDSGKPSWYEEPQKPTSKRKKLDDEDDGAVREDLNDMSGRERLKRHWMEIAGRVCIPDIWGHEGFLKDWIDSTAFEASLVSTTRIMSARAALVEQGRRKAAAAIRIGDRCS